MGYHKTYKSWQDDPEAFWMQAAEAIDWVKAPTKALDNSHAPLYQWYSDGVMNTCYNALDRHVEAGRGEQAAIIYDSPITGAKATISYSEMLDRVSMLAGALARKGVRKGDRVCIGGTVATESGVPIKRIRADFTAKHPEDSNARYVDLFYASAFIGMMLILVFVLARFLLNPRKAEAPDWRGT